MAAKLESTERQSAGAATGSDEKLNQQIRSIVDGLQAIDVQPNPQEGGEPGEPDELYLGIAPDVEHEGSERRAIYDRLVAIEKKTKKRGLGRYLFAILVGVATTLAWQSYGDSAKQIIVTRAPELGWSPEIRQMIATTIQRVGWINPSASLEKPVPLVAQTAATNPSLEAGQVQQMRQSLAGLQQTHRATLGHSGPDSARDKAVGVSGCGTKCKDPGLSAPTRCTGAAVIADTTAAMTAQMPLWS